MTAVLGHEGHREVPGDERTLHGRHLAHGGYGQESHGHPGTHDQGWVTGNQAIGHQHHSDHRGGQAEGDEERAEGGVQPTVPQGASWAPSDR